MRSMIRLRAAATAVIILLVVPWAQTGAESFENALLWRLQPPGDVEPSFLLGTIHLSDPRVLDVTQGATDALARSHTAVFELILNDEVQDHLSKAMFFDDGRRLEDVINADLFAKTVEQARAYSMVPTILQLMKPWAVATVLSLSREEMVRQTRGERALDAVLQDRARAAGLSLVALETIEEQLAVFEDSPESEQVAVLQAVVTQKAEIDKMTEAMVEAYALRDLGAVHEMIEQFADTGAAVEFTDALIYERNDTMSERLLPMVHEGGFFVAVGAAHLPGDNGILQQMIDNGITVTPID